MSWLLKLTLGAGIILLSGCTIVITTAPSHCGCVASNPPKASVIAAHGCAVFGGSIPGTCQNYPAWTAGKWQPPAGVDRAHVLLVAGGGGGSASQIRGIGGTGGGSGKIVTAFVSLAAGNPVDISVGQKGPGASQPMQPGMDGSPSSFGALAAQGGQGGSSFAGGSAAGAGGNNGGGGSYQPGFHPGAGGNGGTGGAAGQTGEAATDKINPVQGISGGVGTAFPVFDFKMVAISAGSGGIGGLTLQLQFNFKMCLLRDVLMSPSPQRPSYNVGRADTFLREPVCYPPDFLD